MELSKILEDPFGPSEPAAPVLQETPEQSIYPEEPLDAANALYAARHSITESVVEEEEDTGIRRPGSLLPHFETPAEGQAYLDRVNMYTTEVVYDEFGHIVPESIYRQRRHQEECERELALEWHFQAENDRPERLEAQRLAALVPPPQHDIHSHYSQQQQVAPNNFIHYSYHPQLPTPPHGVATFAPPALPPMYPTVGPPLYPPLGFGYQYAHSMNMPPPPLTPAQLEAREQEIAQEQARIQAEENQAYATSIALQYQAQYYAWRQNPQNIERR